MLYRVVLIFPDNERLADFIGHLEVPGEVNTRERTFIGNLNEDQIVTACTVFGAYVKVMRIIEQ